MSKQKSYWFGGRRYLLGWGVPLRWQGWAAIISFVAAELGPIVLSPHHNSILLSVYSAAVILAFLIVCTVTCEPPR